MSDREQEINGLLAVYLAQKGESDIAAVAAAFHERLDEALASFQKAVRFCAAETKRLRENTDKGAICWVVISALESGLVTGSLDFRIDFLDEGLWLDENEAAAYWTPAFALSLAAFPTDETLSMLRDSLVRPMAYELLGLEREYLRAVQRSLADPCRELALRSAALVREAGAVEQVEVLFGSYLGETETIAVLPAVEDGDGA
jgi:hypothetical protein